MLSLNSPASAGELAIAETGVERIAAGGITHSARDLDIGLDLVEVLG